MGTFLDDALPDHPKFVGLSNDAFAIWVRCDCYANRVMTDGFIPERTAVGNGGSASRKSTEKAIADLVKAGLWVVVENGFRMHNFLDWNPSRAARLDKLAQAKARKDRWKRARETPAERVREAFQERVPDASPSHPRNALPGSGQDQARSGSRSEISGSVCAAPDVLGPPEPPPADTHTDDTAKALLEELGRHAVLRPVATVTFAEALAGRSHASARPVADLRDAIAAAAVEASATSPPPAQLARLVRTFCDRAGDRSRAPPRRTSVQPIPARRAWTPGDENPT